MAADEKVSRYRIEPIEDPLAFYQPDYSSSPIRPLRPYLEVDLRDRSLRIGYSRSSENATPMRVYYGLARRFYLDNETDPVNLTKAINEGKFDDLFDRLCDMFEIVLDDQTLNYVGRYRYQDGDVQFFVWEGEFNDRVAEYAYPGIANGIWDAAEWIDFHDVLHVYGLNASTTNDELEKIAEAIEEDARKEGVVLVHTWEHLANCRERLIDREG